ncbi:hypothetical protein MKW98_032155 [Papaver atlanticum]|uniref:KIB1-4 beta-propeller domain-containing protein n=1 Tax=Papaver atlanticum TaxID=357466 RepID=A0AAD4SEK1_9MAGN|nr:hypothetical protein MKW98_032155 [Papaver atlanticum]
MCYYQREFEKVVTSILMMRLDFSLMEWKVVNCLGNHVLFAGRNTAYCFVSDLGLARGCLYYTLPADQSLYKFDIEDTAESVILPCPKMPTPWFSSSWITLPNGRGRKEDISFSSLPTAPDCYVFGIDRSGFGTSITIYTIGRGEQEWEFFSLEEFDVQKYSASWNTPTLFYGVFYSVGNDGTLNKLNLLDVTYELLEKPHERFNDSYPSLLVKCGEDLLLVKLGCPKMLVRILRMDFSEMEWVEVESLGKHMLFLSDITCFSAISPNSQMENKVYFPRKYLDSEGILCYSLETGRYHSFGGTSQHSANNIYGTKGWHSNCTWIQPNWSKSTAQELDWMWMGSCLDTNSKEKLLIVIDEKRSENSVALP